MIPQKRPPLPPQGRQQRWPIWEFSSTKETYPFRARHPQKSPTYSTKDSNTFRKRILHIPQKSPTHSAKESYIFRKRVLHIPQKKPTLPTQQSETTRARQARVEKSSLVHFPPKEPYIFRKRNLSCQHKRARQQELGSAQGKHALKSPSLFHFPPKEPYIFRKTALYTPQKTPTEEPYTFKRHPQKSPRHLKDTRKRALPCHHNRQRQQWRRAAHGKRALKSRSLIFFPPKEHHNFGKRALYN